MFAGSLRGAKRKLLAAVLAVVPGAVAWEFALSRPEVRAQAPAQTTRIHIKSRVFHLPIRIDRASLSKIKEVCLWMKEGQGEWVRRDSVPPTVESFRCQVPRDGEYSFAVVTVDHQGNNYPPDLNAAPPAMTVLVETQQPRDNVIIEPGMSPPSYVEVTESQNTPVIVNGGQHLSRGPQIDQGTPHVVQSSPAAVQAGQPMMQPVTQPILQAAPPAAAGQPLSYAPSLVTPNRQVINTTRVGIDYNIGRIGPSGLGKVEVWATQDQGRSWQRIGEDADQRSPAEVDLPGEGTFGIRLVAINGNGFGGKSPNPGDQPASTFEVDLTNPTINSFEVDPFSKGGTLEIRYRVTEKNLTAEPISLYYSSQRSGPWTPIGVRLKNEGSYRWVLPRDLPGQLFFRMECADIAGNVGRLDMQNPVMLDMTEPDVNVTGITAMPQRTASPGN